MVGQKEQLCVLQKVSCLYVDFAKHSVLLANVVAIGWSNPETPLRSQCY